MILAAVAILFLVSLILAGLDRSRIRIGYAWFLGVGASLVSWILVLIFYPVEAQAIPLLDWESSALSIGSPGLRVDAVSWPYAVAILTLLLSILLTEGAHVHEMRVGSWAAAFALAGAGLLAVTAANPLTLLLTWALVDLSETTILMVILKENQKREQLVITFFVRVFGLFWVIAAILQAQVAGKPLVFDALPIEGSIFLVLAASLRLGVFPPHSPYFQDPALRRGLITLVRLVPVAASLVLLSRVAAVGVVGIWDFPLLAVAAWAMVYGIFAWLSSSNELDGRPFWILGLSSFVVAAAVHAQSQASQAWGLTLVFTGSVLFLYSVRSPRSIVIPMIGLVGSSALPFTPAWQGMALFSNIHPVFAVIFGLGLAGLIGGYFRHLMRVDASPEALERWVWLVYPLGLAFLPLSHWFVSWKLGFLSLPAKGVSPLIWVGGAAVAGLAALSWTFRLNLASRITRMMDWLRKIFSLTWFYRSLWWIYRTASRLITYLGRIFEGEGGVLWAVLIITLLVLIVVRLETGG